MDATAEPSAEVGRAVIAVVGSANADLHMSTDRLPVRGSTVLAQSTRWLPGGKGANQALAGARLGADVSFVAAVGDDAMADIALAGLADDGVTLHGVRRIHDTASGVAVVCVDASGDNLIVVSPGANAMLQPTDVRLPANCAATLVSLEIPSSAARAALDQAHRAAALAVLNAGPDDAVTRELIDHADVLVANEGEASTLAGDRGLAALAGVARTTIVATAGAGIVRAVTPDGTEHRVPVRSVDVVDTVGAGDCFAAALTVALAERVALPDALRFATAAAALKVGRLGARGVPTRAEVEQFVDAEQ